MKSTPIVTALICLVLASRASSQVKGDEPLPLPKLKTLCLETLIVDQGRPNAVIVAPDTPEDRKLAEQVQSAIREATGGELAIRKDTEFANGFGQLAAGAPDRNVIVLGRKESNDLIRHLCYQSYCQVDASYPGEGASLVQTIHDPWGTGVNAVVLGGSDSAGVARAVRDFVGMVPRGKGFVLPRTFRLSLPPKARQQHPDWVKDVTDAEIAEKLVSARKDFREGLQAGLFRHIIGAGDTYARTGLEGYAKLYRELVFLEDELRRNEPAPWDSPWGGAADFLFRGFIRTLDNVEESPSLSDADRERLLRIVLDYIRYYEGYGTTKGMERQVIRNNHNTFTNEGFMAAGLYFKKYYHLPQADKWLETADLCFRPNLQSFQTQEDCGGYQWITLRHNCEYSVGRLDFSWFTSGKAAVAGDIGIMTTDNLGNAVSFGDVGGFTGAGQTALWSYLVDIQKSGRFAWAMTKANPSAKRDPKIRQVKLEEPVDLLGVKCMANDPMYYSLYSGKESVPRERTFDKITLRQSFDPAKQYLLLDGLNGGYHGHWDGNSILRLTDRSRIWLCDCDYIKSLPKVHNSVLVFRDGKTASMPIFCERELVADLGRTGITRTSVHDYAGADWRRNILWDKERAFVVIDELTALKDDDYSFRCYWQTLGEPRLEGNLFRVTQKGPQFAIRNLDGARLRWADDPELGANWAAYPHADPIIRTLQQARTLKLRAGEKAYFLNVLSSHDGGSQVLPSERVSDSSMLVGSGADQALVGLQAGENEIVPGLKTDAQVYWISAKRIALGQVTRLSLNGRELLSGKDPISIEFAPGGKAIVDSEKPTEISVAGKRIALKAGGSPVPEMAVRSRFEVKLPKPTPAAAPALGAPVAGSAKLAEVAHFAPAKGKLLRMAADGDTIVTGGTEGKVYAVGRDMKPRWEFDAGSEVRTLWVGKLGKDDPPRIAVGTKKGLISLLDQSGKLVWQQQIPYYKQEPGVVYFTSADLAGDENRALIAGAECWRHYAYDAGGKPLWQFESVRTSSTGTAADLDGDGKEEVVVGTEYNSVIAINPDGSQKWRVSKMGGPKINSIVTPTVAGDKSPTVLFGGAEGSIYALTADGKRQWSYSTGDEITKLAMMDVDGDGVSEVLACSMSFNLNAVKPDGTRLWRKDLGEPLTAMELADLNGDGIAEICVATQDGHVMALGRDGNPLATWSAEGSLDRLLVIPGSPARLAVLCKDGRLVILAME